MTGWQGWHLYYYDPEKDGVLLDGVAPVVQALQEEARISRFYLLRHWRQGPHVVVNLHPAPGEYDRVAESLEQGLRDYLGAHPSRVPIDQEQMLQLHQKLARLELDPGPLEPLQPDNALLQVPYQRPFQVAGEGAATAAEAFLARATPILLEMMAQTRGSPGRRRVRILQLMMGLAATAGDLRYSHLSFRSHAEAFLHKFDRTGKLRAELDTSFARTENTLRAALQQVVDPYGAGGRSDQVLVAWQELLTESFATLEPQLEQGEVVLPTEEHFQSRARELSANTYETGDSSPFHQRLLGSQLYQYAASSSRFQATRCLVNWLYTSLTLTGIAPLERYQLCYLLSRTAEVTMGAAWEVTVG